MANILDTNRQIVEAIRNLAFSACCPDIPLTDQPTQDTEILPGVGDPPATWGDEPVTDWEDWERLVCGYANGWIDRQISNANLMQTLITTGTLTVALIVGIMYVAGLLVISMGTAAGIWGGVGALYGTFVFSSAATAFEENRDEIICKILSDEGVGEFRDYMQSIIPPLAWSGFYTWLDYQHIVNSIWEGQNPDGSLEVTRMDCPNCEPVYDFDILSTRLTNGPEIWTSARVTPPLDNSDKWLHYPRSGFGESRQTVDGTMLRTFLDVAANEQVAIARVTVHYEALSQWYPPKTVSVQWYESNVLQTVNHVIESNETLIQVYDIVDHTFTGGVGFQINGLHNGSSTNNDFVKIFIHSVRIQGHVTVSE